MKINKLVAICSFMMIGITSFSQNIMKDIKGIVCDENGEPIIGESFMVKVTPNGTISPPSS